ncbi:hypothetical protein Tco_1439268 [Tanacetum coccineum]
MGGSYYLIPCSILSTEKDHKTPQRYLNVPTTSWRISIRSMDSFQGHTPKSPSSWHRPLAPKDLALYDNESWNDPRDFDKPIKAITLPQDVPCTSNRRLIELENQVQRLMEAHLALTQPTQVNKITTLCEICSGPHDTQYCMEDPEQAFVEYISSRTDKAGEGLVSEFMASQDARLSKFEADFKRQQEDNGEVMFIEIIRDNDEPQNEGANEGEGATTEESVVEYFDTFPTRDELTYPRYLMSGSIPSIFLRNPIITEGCPYNLKIPCNIGHMHIEKAYIDLNSPLNIMTQMMYNWIMRRILAPRENANGGISNFTGRIKGMHVFMGNFTYVVVFMIVEDISSIIDPRLSQVVLGGPFVEISNMTHDLPEGVVRFIKGANKVTYKMPYKIEQYNSLSDLEKEHTKLVYLRNEEDKRRVVEYVMSKTLGFYKECLELGPEYLTRMDDDREVTYGHMTSSLATRLVNKEKRFLGGNPIYFSLKLGVSGILERFIATDLAHLRRRRTTALRTTYTTLIEQNRISLQWLETASQIQRDAVTMKIKTAS